MENYILVKNDELYHHGILGQKWGVRRFQNKDGSLTAAGRKKYTKFDSEGYKYDRKRELENEGVTGLKKAMLVNNESYLLGKSDKDAYKAMIKQEQLIPKIKDAVELRDSKQFGKLLKKWTEYQSTIRYDEILQNKDKIEPLAKGFIKARMGQMTLGLGGGFLGGMLQAATTGKSFIDLSSDYMTEARQKSEKDAEEYKKQFK